MGRVLRRLRYWLGQDDYEAALAEEIEFHRALKQGELEADGIAPEEARLASRREMGNLTRAREESRGVWIWPWLESVWQDARIAIRALLKQPGFALLAVVVLGIAIGLNASPLHGVRRCGTPADDRRHRPRASGHDLGTGAAGSESPVRPVDP
jgi:hypothetical protein